MSRRVTTSDPPCPLVEGQRLDQPSFHARGRALPQGVRAELIGGVVFMPGPLGGLHGQAQAAAPDISLDEPKDSTASGVDIELGSTQTLKTGPADETVIAGGQDKSLGAMDFNLDLGMDEKKPEASKAEAPKPAAESSGGLDFDLNLDGDKQGEPAAAAEVTPARQLRAAEPREEGEAEAAARAQSMIARLEALRLRQAFQS